MGWGVGAHSEKILCHLDNGRQAQAPEESAELSALREELQARTGSRLSDTALRGILGRRAAEAEEKVDKAFDERAYRSIDHLAVGMALLCHRSFPDEEANGVALTANIFDTSGLEPGFYINVQKGGASVVLPEAGITTDQIIYHYYQPGQPAIFLSHSNLVADGETVLTPTQLYKLGRALEHIHVFWMDTYGPSIGAPTSFYAMDVEFKFDGDLGQEPELFVKQARPHPGWGL